jgi:D-alanyl-lipoteichoic acid acyltransferase DltB (MBOAT superfamily)
MMPQFASRWNWVKRYRNIVTGIFIFSDGLFKKLSIADTFAIWANSGYGHTPNLAFFEAWATSLSYTFQLYFDFSGYSDMAVGLALLFNIKLPFNFNSPYKSKNIQDFWRRWHITLSRFLKAYVYIPMGGNRSGSFRTYLNLFITFIIGGIWHGAGWTFVIWGALHGISVVIHRAWQILGIRMNSVLAWFFTFNFINITWIFFRSKDIESALDVIKGMFGGGGLILPSGLSSSMGFWKHYGVQYGDWLADWDAKEEIIYLVGGFLAVLLLKNSLEWSKSFKPTLGTLLIGSLLLSLAFVKLSSLRITNEFLYFNF